MSPAAVVNIAPIIKVDRVELRDDVLDTLIGMRVSSGLRIPSRATLDFLDDGFAISAGHVFKLGAEVTISTGDGKALFDGKITGVNLDIERGAPNLTVIADDYAYPMTLNTVTKSEAQKSFHDIVGNLALVYKLDKAFTGTPRVQDYILQADTDFGFLNEIADRAGYDWWVDAQRTLHFHPAGEYDGPVADVAWTGTHAGLQQFSVRATGLHPRNVAVDGWDPDQQQAVTTSAGASGKQPDAALVQPFVNGSGMSQSADVSTVSQSLISKEESNDYASGLATRAVASAVTATGVCHINPAIVVGGRVKISGVGPASGTYPVTEVEHSYSPRGFDTTFVAGEREPNSLVDTLGLPQHSSLRVQGLVVGVVTNLGDTSTPAGYVKVQFPTLGKQIESAWARVVSTGAGDSRGMTFLPEINDEVIVGFEGGDVARPLVLGGLFSGKFKALDYGAGNGAVAKRQIVSRLGHVLEFGDGDGEPDQHIWMTLAGGEFFIKLGKDGLSAQVPSGKPVTLAAGDTKIAFDSQGNITIAGKKVTIKAEQGVEVSGQSVKAKANTDIELSGLNVKAKASASAEVSSSGETSIKGGMVKIN